MRSEKLDVTTLEANMKRVLAEGEEVSKAVGLAKEAINAKKLAEDKAKVEELAVKQEEGREQRGNGRLGVERKELFKEPNG